jgi:hypothetical protein
MQGSQANTSILNQIGLRPPAAEEQKYLDALRAYDATDGGYSEIMCTRPDRIAAP